MGSFKAFENDSQSFSVGAGEGLTAQNGIEVVSIWGEAKFKPDAAGRQAADELRDVLQSIAAGLVPGVAEKALWVKTSSGGLTIGGDLDLEKGKSSSAALKEAVESLTAFSIGSAPVKKTEKKETKAPKK